MIEDPSGDHAGCRSQAGPDVTWTQLLVLVRTQMSPRMLSARRPSMAYAGLRAPTGAAAVAASCATTRKREKIIDRKCGGTHGMASAARKTRTAHRTGVRCAAFDVSRSIDELTDRYYGRSTLRSSLDAPRGSPPSEFPLGRCGWALARCCCDELLPRPTSRSL